MKRIRPQMGIGAAGFLGKGEVVDVLLRRSSYRRAARSRRPSPAFASAMGASALPVSGPLMKMISASANVVWHRTAPARRCELTPSGTIPRSRRDRRRCCMSNVGDGRKTVVTMRSLRPAQRRQRVRWRLVASPPARNRRAPARRQRRAKVQFFIVSASPFWMR